MARGIFNILDVQSGSDYVLTVDVPDSVAVGDHLGARISSADGAVYLVTEVNGDQITVQDVLTEAEPAAFGQPIVGSAGYGTPEAVFDLTQLPFNAPGWDAAYRRNAKLLDSKSPFKYADNAPSSVVGGGATVLDDSSSNFAFGNGSQVVEGTLQFVYGILNTAGEATNFPFPSFPFVGVNIGLFNTTRGARSVAIGVFNDVDLESIAIGRNNNLAGPGDVAISCNFINSPGGENRALGSRFVDFLGSRGTNFGSFNQLDTDCYVRGFQSAAWAYDSSAVGYSALAERKHSDVRSYNRGAGEDGDGEGNELFSLGKAGGPPPNNNPAPEDWEIGRAQTERWGAYKVTSDASAHRKVVWSAALKEHESFLLVDLSVQAWQDADDVTDDDTDYASFLYDKLLQVSLRKGSETVWSNNLPYSLSLDDDPVGSTDLPWEVNLIHTVGTDGDLLQVEVVGEPGKKIHWLVEGKFSRLSRLTDIDPQDV